jgi:CHAD domain-containing protein
MDRNVDSETELRHAFARQARKFRRVLSKGRAQVLRSCDAEAIHDLRVATRRLQTLVDLKTLSKPDKKAAKLRKRMKALRHALGRRRDVDVLLEKLRERARNTASAARRRLLRSLVRQLAPERKRIDREMRAEVKKASGSKLGHLVRRALDVRRDKNLTFETLNSAVRRAEQNWLTTIDAARKRDDSARFHDVRIKTKTLRYMLEQVSQFVGIPDVDAVIEWLKEIQDELGEWHDAVEECRRVTELLSKDADYQTDNTATALIKSLRDRTEASTKFVRTRIESLRDTWSRRKGILLSLPGRKKRMAAVS